MYSDNIRCTTYIVLNTTNIIISGDVVSFIFIGYKSTIIHYTVYIYAHTIRCIKFVKLGIQQQYAV